MDSALKTLAALAYAYLTGSIPLAYILGRALKGIDIRKYGSGNVGASNAWQHIGRGWAPVLLLFDVLVKGSSPVWLARYGLDLGLESQAAVGLAAVAGHNWSLYLKFTGGRGLATGLGALLALSPLGLGLFVAVALAGWALTKEAGLWWIISGTLLPLEMLLLGRPLAVVYFGAGFLLLTIAKRLWVNGMGAPTETGYWAVMRNRLLYDRDIADRGQWVRRKPPKGAGG